MEFRCLHRHGDVAVLATKCQGTSNQIRAAVMHVITTIVTKRLTMRPFTLDDAGFIVDLVNDPDWLRFIGDKAVASKEDARRYLTKGPLAMYQVHGFGLCAV